MSDEQLEAPYAHDWSEPGYTSNYQIGDCVRVRQAGPPEVILDGVIVGIRWAAGVRYHRVNFGTCVHEVAADFTERP